MDVLTVEHIEVKTYSRRMLANSNQEKIDRLRFGNVCYSLSIVVWENLPQQSRFPVSTWSIDAHGRKSRGWVAQIFAKILEGGGLGVSILFKFLVKIARARGSLILALMSPVEIKIESWSTGTTFAIDIRQSTVKTTFTVSKCWFFCWDSTSQLITNFFVKTPIPSFISNSVSISRKTPWPWLRGESYRAFSSLISTVASGIRRCTNCGVEVGRPSLQGRVFYLCN